MPLELAVDLRLILEQIDRLVTATRNPDGHDEADSELMKNLSAVAMVPQVVFSTEANDASAEDVVDVARPDHPLPVGCGYSVYFDPADTEPETEELQSTLPTTTGGSGFDDLCSTSRVFREATAVALSSSIRGPQTFSFRESTFARRLQRRGLEAGFRYGPPYRALLAHSFNPETVSANGMRQPPL